MRKSGLFYYTQIVLKNFFKILKFALIRPILLFCTGQTLTSIREATRINSLIWRALSESVTAVQRATQTIASGSRINTPADDPAGIQLVESLKVEIVQRIVGIRNTQDFISFFNITSKAVDQKKIILTRLRELAQSASNGSLSLTDRLSKQAEFAALVREYNAIDSKTKFNGISVFSSEKYNLHAGSLIEFNLQSPNFQNIIKSGIVSSLQDNTLPNAAVNDAEMSADGRFVVFSSSASNLPSANGQTQVYLKDTFTGELALVSSTATGTPGNGNSSKADITPDGRFIVFQSDSTNLVTGVSGTQIYRKDRITGDIVLVSSNQDGVAGNNFSSDAKVSHDGNYVFFTSFANNLVTGSSGAQIYRKNLKTGSVQVITSSSNWTPGNGAISNVRISSDGKYAVFMSASSNLISGVSGWQVYRKNAETGAIELASADASGIKGDAVSWFPSISGDGRYVVFTSNSTNFVLGVTGWQIYRKDMLTGAIELVSASSSGQQGNGFSLLGRISDDGRYVSFISPSNNLVEGLVTLKQRVFVKDMETGQIRLLTDLQDGPDNQVSSLSMSADGTVIVVNYSENGDISPAMTYLLPNPLLINPTNKVLSGLTKIGLWTQLSSQNALEVLNEYEKELNDFTGTMGAFDRVLNEALTSLQIQRLAYEDAKNKILAIDITEELSKLITSHSMSEITTKLGLDKTAVNNLLKIIKDSVEVAYRASQNVIQPLGSDLRFTQNSFTRSQVALTGFDEWFGNSR